MTRQNRDTLAPPDWSLEAALTQWRRAARGCGAIQRTHLEELEDHLRCEIDVLIGQGMGEEQAFAMASETMGDPRALAAEMEAIQPPVTRAMRTALRGIYRMEKNSMKAARSSTLMIGSSLVWAAMMIACSLVLRGSEHASDVHFTLLSGWFATFFLLQPSSAETAKAEWACLKRWVSMGRR